MPSRFRGGHPETSHPCGNDRILTPAQPHRRRVLDIIPETLNEIVDCSRPCRLLILGGLLFEICGNFLKCQRTEFRSIPGWHGLFRISLYHEPLGVQHGFRNILVYRLGLSMVGRILESLCPGCPEDQGWSNMAVGSGNSRDHMADCAAGMCQQVYDRFLPCHQRNFI